MPNTSTKANQEPHELSARTLKILMSWEEKHGLEVIKQHLDDGLFSRDPVERRMCYRWLDRRRAALRNNVMAEVALGASAFIGLVSYLFWA